MALLPIVLLIFGTAEAVTGAVVFIMFIKEEAIQSVGMAAFQALKFNQKTKAKELYQKLRDVYIPDLARTTGYRHDFDAELVAWAGWPEWKPWEDNVPEAEFNNWGGLAPYAKPAFVSFVNASLLNCKTMLDIL